MKKDASTFYYTDKKISDCNLEEAKANVDMMIHQVEREVRKKLRLGTDSSVYITICDMKIIE